MIGSIKKRTLQDGRSVRWDFVWDEPTSGGGRRQRSKTFRRRKDAEQFRVKTAHELFDGTYVKPSKRTVGEFLEAWIEEIAPPISNPSTFNSYTGIARNHWVRLLGSIRLEGLTKADVQRAHREMLQEGTAASTLRVRQAVLTKALTRAVDLQLVKRNVASNAMLPEAEELARPAWSAADVRRFCEANVDDPRLVLWRLALDSGMRIGELLALKWVDVDWEHGSIRVRRKLVRGDDGRGWAIREGTKSRAGRRTIPLSSSTMAALRQHRSVVLQLRLEFGGMAGLRPRVSAPRRRAAAPADRPRGIGPSD
jgi:integrase